MSDDDNAKVFADQFIKQTGDAGLACLRAELAAERELKEKYMRRAVARTRERNKLREALKEIATHDDLELALEPQWPKRRARAVLDETAD